MNLRNIFFIISSLLLGSCVQAPAIKSVDHALITSSYPIVSANGVDIEDTYELDIDTGKNTLVIVYHTYAKDYHCAFTWDAVAGSVYEVTDQGNKYPLTLYRWDKTNSLWANRLDPVDPLKCSIVNNK